MMVKHIALLFLMFSLLNNIQAQQPSDKIIGIWLSKDKTKKIEIYSAGSFYSGKIVWLAKLDKKPERKRKDVHNPNPELRNREILGLDIITGLQYSKDKWVNGKLYAPKKGIYAMCTIDLLSYDLLKISVSILGTTRTETWTRE